MCPETACSSVCRWDTQLLRIDPQSGRILFPNREGADVFDSEVRSAYLLERKSTPSRQVGV